MPYVAQPGTIPHRALEHLKTLDGKEVSNADLADALDVAPETLVTTLVIACKHGAIDRRKRVAAHSNRKVWWYSLGDGTPEGDLPDNLPEQPLPREAPRKQSSFDAWLSTSGTLRIQGAAIASDGSVTLDAAQTSAVKRLIAWSQAAC